MGTTPRRSEGVVGPGRVVVVTGSASGIGADVVNHLLSSGNTVIGVDRDPQTEREGLHAIQTDVTDVEAARETLAMVQSRFGRVDGLVTSAGISHVAPVEAFDLDAVMRTMTVNFVATALWISAAIPYLRKGNGGRIVTVSSQLAQYPNPGTGYYAASKAAVVCFTRTTAVELARDGITVNCVCPGPTDTPLTAKFRASAGNLDSVLSRVPLARMATATEVAEPIVFLLSAAASYITGATLFVDGGFF